MESPLDLASNIGLLLELLVAGSNYKQVAVHTYMQELLTPVVVARNFEYLCLYFPKPKHVVQEVSFYEIQGSK